MQQAIVDLVDVCPGVQDIENRLSAPLRSFRRWV